MKSDFGFFNVLKINGENFQIAKSKEMGKTGKPIEQFNSNDFEQEAVGVKAKESEAYQKSFVLEYSLMEIHTEKIMSL
ncbi:hypothetical protein [Algoriphagus resistens]|uniref:hypothetical protein n=1 Tax=Algoriphagus resistens TaxID=1750590 RepID=UPI000716B3DD|nr:hypothetical protein [Algoriphagus resistens]